MEYYRSSLKDLYQQFHVSPGSGLSDKEVAQRQKEYGLNRLEDGKKKSLIYLFFNQFKSPLIYILVAAGCLIFFLGNPLDAFFISFIILFNALIGTIQEGRAQDIVSRLRRFIKGSVVVLRNGERNIAEHEQLVPGDIIILSPGDRVPADARVIKSAHLRVNEALLTGESLPVAKQSDELVGELRIFEQTNMLFMGTMLTQGTATALVVATGNTTQLGALHKTITDIEVDMPLKRELTTLSHAIVVGIFGIIIALFGIGMVLHRPWHELLVTLTTLFICVIPEGLPLTFTVVLVAGVYRLARHNMLVKRMQAVEGLGRTDVIILDKTGTLTRNELVVQHCYYNDQLYEISGEGYSARGTVTPVSKGPRDEGLHDAAKACALLASAYVAFDEKSGTYAVKGDPTEAAMGVFAHKIIGPCEREQLVLDELPFSDALKIHSVLYRGHDGISMAVAGSLEKLQSYGADSTAELKTQEADLLQRGYRVVAVACGNAPDQNEQEASLEAVRIFLAGKPRYLLLGMWDALRPEVPEMIRGVRESGIEVVMATGDHAQTARALAQAAGMLHHDDVVTGDELARWSAQDFEKRIAQTHVYARLTAEDKVKIVKTWQHAHKIVAMTGDGVNDVPALMAADLGIALGKSGSESAQEAGDMILLDDSFSTIVNAIEEGRHIFYALRRVVIYFFATNLAEVFLIVITLILNLPLPLYPAQILWLNLITDGFLDVALSAEPREPGLLQSVWLRRIQQTGLVDRSLLITSFLMALPMALGSILVFYMTMDQNIDHARTLAFVCMALFQWFNAFNCRSERRSLFSLGLFSNYWLLLASALVIMLQLSLLYVPFLAKIFRTEPLSLHEWLYLGLLASSIIFIDELRKLYVRSRLQ